MDAALHARHYGKWSSQRFLSGLLGVGGGFVIVPVLRRGDGIAHAWRSCHISYDHCAYQCLHPLALPCFPDTAFRCKLPFYVRCGRPDRHVAGAISGTTPGGTNTAEGLLPFFCC